jgi:hypothetical protein
VAERLARFANPPVVVLAFSRARVKLAARLDTAPMRGFPPKKN